MGIAALATLPVYLSSFRFMQLATQSLARTEGGYFVYNAVSHGICLAVMFPAAFCAGMTLPLITASLLRRGAGERAIGQVYAANTAGAIAGVLAAVHLGSAPRPERHHHRRRRDRLRSASRCASRGRDRARAALHARCRRAALAVIGAGFLVQLTHLMSSGVFRQGKLSRRGTACTCSSMARRPR
jgi:hypothetical protein